MTTNLAARNGSGVLGGGKGVRKALTTCTLNPPEPEQNPEALQQHASRPHCLGIPYLQPPKTSEESVAPAFNHYLPVSGLGCLLVFRGCVCDS